jgi:hypothetical protein
MATDLSLINSALTRTGNEPVTTLNDGTPGGNIAGQNYAGLVKKELSGYPWKWATKTAILSALSGTPDPPWLTAYQLPTDVLFLRVVTVGGQPIDYEQQFNKLLCNYAVGTDVIAKYTWSVPESYWPGDFAEAVTQMLEAMFLRGIGERFEEAEARAKEARATMQAAKTADAKKASPRDPFVSGTLAARGGVVAVAPLPWR